MAKKTKQDCKSGLITEIIKYLEQNSSPVPGTGFKTWSVYPVCVQDIAVDSVWVENSKVYFGDFDESRKELKTRRTSDNTDIRYLQEVFDNMKTIDKKHR